MAGLSRVVVEVETTFVVVTNGCGSKNRYQNGTLFLVQEICAPQGHESACRRLDEP